MSKQFSNGIEKMVVQQYLVLRDVKQVISSSISHLILKISPYFYNNGISVDLLCLCGTVSIQHKGNRYNIPVEIWLQKDYPLVAPVVYVKPTFDMYIASASGNVNQDGLVVLSYLESWHHTNNLYNLLRVMSESFSKSPPVYAKFSPHYKSLSNSNASSSGPTYSSMPNNVNEQKQTHRFSDIAAEPRRMLLPIQGFEKMPLVSLEKAIRPVVSFVPDVEQMVWIAKENCHRPKDGLTTDESASIMLYTMQWEPYEKSFYVKLNTTLRASVREQLKPWFLYLRLIINVLQKLPSTHHVVYRGIKSDLTAQYSQGSTIVWWGFSSCTRSIETLKNECFLGKKGKRTLFHIECASGKNIQSHSFYAEEDEVLLPPARQFEVIGCLNQGNGLQIIQLRETQPKFPLIKLNSS
ncbi:unnamed protein product [Rotaria sordida]|uniref:NAD(P)(+)--arginine ADP-ribosyltransferase n=1 Tax=Rotaria sordida TaxID=392033 RepID=A0A816E540_9BILA|nr:unnamed protein product [Rotaria sordida]CAF1642239.1 unnamed protein product [Rotaria sordida]